MAPPPYRQPGADVAFWTLFGVFALGEYAIRFRSLLNRSGRRVDVSSLPGVLVTVVAGLIIAFWFGHRQAVRIEAGRWPLFVLGLVLMAAGTGIRQWAIRILGRFFTVDVRVHPDQLPPLRRHPPAAHSGRLVS